MTIPKYIADSKMFEYDKHYRNCHQLHRPFIKAVINPKHKNYYVKIDLMTCNYDFAPKHIDKILNLVKRYGLGSYHIDEDLAWFDGVKLDDLETFCTSLYDLVTIKIPSKSEI